jgi:predicted membrane protein
MTMESHAGHNSTSGRHWDRPDWVHRARHAGGMSHLAMGIFLTLLGFVLTLDRLEIVDGARALQWWPIGFHLLGATILLRRTDNHGRFWGIVWIVIGSWLLLNTLNIVRIGLVELLWPALLMFIGVRLMMRGRLATASGEPAGPAAGAPNLLAVMSEAKGAVTQTLSRASMTSVMGGCRLDLRQAIIPPDAEPVVDVFTLMGGLEVVAPSNWTIVIDVVTIMAAAEDKRLPSVASPSDLTSGGPVNGPPRLTIRGTLILGGLTVKN